MPSVITMSRTEVDRMSVLHDLADGRIKVAEASTLMGLGRRQVFRLRRRTARMADGQRVYIHGHDQTPARHPRRSQHSRALRAPALRLRRCDLRPVPVGNQTRTYR